MRSSSWQGGTFTVQHPTAPEHEYVLSLQELHLVERVRKSGRGSHTLIYTKTDYGRDGLHGFLVKDSATDE